MRDKRSTPSKKARLKFLARKRQHVDLQALFGSRGPTLYSHIKKFQRGAYDCDHVSPWTKCAANLDADVMVVGQDWSSSKNLEVRNEHVIAYGFDPKFPTNKNLHDLLERHLGLEPYQCYFTNLFPFIKVGKANQQLPIEHLAICARAFLMPQIDIVRPRIVICLGFQTHLALMQGIGGRMTATLGRAIDTAPYRYRGTLIFAAAHTGAWGMHNRGRGRVESDWRRFASYLYSVGDDQRPLSVRPKIDRTSQWRVLPQLQTALTSKLTTPSGPLADRNFRSPRVADRTHPILP